MSASARKNDPTFPRPATRAELAEAAALGKVDALRLFREARDAQGCLDACADIFGYVAAIARAIQMTKDPIFAAELSGAIQCLADDWGNTADVEADDLLAALRGDDSDSVDDKPARG